MKRYIVGADMAELLTLSDSDELERASQQELSLIYFGTPWSAPCRSQHRVFIDFSRKYNGLIIIARVDVEKHPRISRKCNIQTVPTLIVYKKSKEIRRMVGLQSIENINALLKEIGFPV